MGSPEKFCLMCKEHHRPCACERAPVRVTDYTVSDALGLRRMDVAQEFAAHGISMRRLRTLAANLAVGGALCASWTRGHNVGFDVGWDDASGRHGGDPSDKWRPGCGRAWGGGE